MDWIAHYYDKEIDARIGMLKQLLGTAKAFAKAAEIKNGQSPDDITNFKLAAYNFKLSGLKFREVAEMLVKVISVVNCKKLKAKANTFQGKANAFKTAADRINVNTGDAEDDAKAAITAFKSAMEIFGNQNGDNNTAAAKFNTFAQATSNPTLVQLTTTAEAFKEKAALFAEAATAFQTWAQLVQAGGGNDQLGGIKQDFKRAAALFGKTLRQDRAEGAAEKFYDAIKILAGLPDT